MTRLSVMASFLVTFAATCGAAEATSLISNGGFEDLDGLGGFVGWTITGTGIAPDSVFPNSGNEDALFSDTTGTTPASTLSQVVSTDGGAGYVISFALLDQAGFSGDTFRVQFGGFSGTVTGDLAAPPGTLPSFYTAFTFDIPGSAITGQTTTLSFSGQSDPVSGIAWSLDDVALTEISPVVTVPESGSFATFAGAMGILICLRHRSLANREG